jgi:hypothetical protein
MTGQDIDTTTMAAFRFLPETTMSTTVQASTQNEKAVAFQLE